MKLRLFAFLVALAAALPASAQSQTVRSPGDAAPVFALRILNPQDDGARLFDLRSFVGSDADQPTKLVLLSFFATWCHACLKEMPLLVRLEKTYRSQGLRVVSISIDREDSEIAKIPDILKEKQVVHPVLSDSRNIVARRYLGSDVKLPSLVLIGADGNIAVMHNGYGDDLATVLEGEVRHALGLGKTVEAQAR
jgi:thiol-disulfide isomerase/thioredoxin